MKNPLVTFGLVLILSVLVFGGCGLTMAQPTEVPPASDDRFLFFEVYMVPAREEHAGCVPLVMATFLDFPTYCFDESTSSLYTYMAPAPYDIEFNEGLRALVGQVAIGRKSGACSHLEPIDSLPYSFYLRPGHGHGYSVDLTAVGEVYVMDTTDSGLLVIGFADRTISLSPGNGWGKEIGSCGERIYMVNHGFLDKKTNNETLRTFLHSFDYGAHIAKIYQDLANREERKGPTLSNAAQETTL